ncbi:hypothetical protein ACFVFQ_31865 [Streptomyces sp. NPDC057743]|uniref:hypothetical protein n=1 Tax=Streptomyces sp. NPDC057743 TaxID=3346236 RepID=UPI003687A7CB
MPDLDWQGRHTLNTATATAVTSTLAASSLTYVSGIHPMWDMAIAAGGALGTALDGARRGRLGGTLTYRAGLWLAAGGWSSWAAAGGPPWSLPTLATLAGGALIGRLSWSAVGRYESAEKLRRTAAARAAEEAERQEQHDAWGAQWKDRLARIAKLDGCKIVAIQLWQMNTGYTVEADLPGGATWGQLKRFEDALGSDLRLNEGCGVEVAGGRRKGTAIIRVSTTNVMQQKIEFPLDLSPTSIDDEFAIGLHRDGTPALGSLAFQCGLGIGDTGSGKTTTLNTINAQLIRTIDALVWHIDTTGAGLSLPWLTSWAIEGTHKRPVIDWTAHTLDETRAMLTMALQIIEVRKRRYQKLMRQANDTKLPARADVPAIIIVVDETADQPRDIKQQIETIMNTGRAVRVRVKVSSLRATSDSIPVPVKKRAKWRWGMYVTDPEELSYLFSGFQQVDPADAPWPGCGFNAYNSTKPRPFKAFNLTPDRIDQIAAACSARRPELDEISRSVPHGRYYPSRWARVLPHLYEGETLHDVTRPYTDIPVIAVPTTNTPNLTKNPTTGATPGGPGTGITPGSAEWTRLFPHRSNTVPKPEDTPTPPEPTSPPDPEPEPGKKLRLVVDNTDDTPTTPPKEPPGPASAEQSGGAEEPPAGAQQPAAPMPSAQDAAMRLLLDAGPEGTGPSRMEADLKALGYGTHRTTISGWLRRWVASAEVRQMGTGTQAYYVHRSNAHDN